jgi:hypothetical protein
MEVASQKWPNLRYKSYSKPCLSALCFFAWPSAILFLQWHPNKSLFSPTLHLGK